MMFRYILIVIGVILFAMLIYGLTLGETCTEIGSCRACWSTVPVTITSELCPDPAKPCTAEPYLQQHNALVDMILCACEQAVAGDYSDTELNSNIESAVKEMTGYTVTASQVCDQPGMILTKRSYS